MATQAILVWPKAQRKPGGMRAAAAGTLAGVGCGGGSGAGAPQREVSGLCFFSPLRVTSPSPLAATKTPGRAPQGGHSVSCALRLQRIAVPPPGVSSAWGLRAASALPFPVPPGELEIVRRAEVKSEDGLATTTKAPSREAACAAEPPACAPVLSLRRSMRAPPHSQAPPRTRSASVSDQATTATALSPL